MSLIARIVQLICGHSRHGIAVDVEQHLDDRAKNSREQLDWRHSIVDLMKLLGLAHDESHRRQLAHELGYSGDMADSAAMNVWLHRQVMRRLRDNGGKVPEELLDGGS